MIYRREIDGLRAVAVIPVIFFHAGIDMFQGGYIGVDVFFVISGYLITSILISEISDGTFSIGRFYERRARRILPALCFVVAASIPFAYASMNPNQLEEFSKSLISVMTFSSNILFWRESGYFATSSELKPLLHTWSLAVEEQYYLVFPLFIAYFWRLGQRRLLIAICIILSISLLMSEWGWRYQPDANFYLAPTRAWELLIGSISAFALANRPQPQHSSWSALGMVLIIYSMIFYDESIPFPSLYALLPTIGASLIIVFGGDKTWTSKILGNRQFVGIGLISYSAYLWHQPLFAFARIHSQSEEPPEQLMLGLAILSLLLAYLSWRFVEAPFRKSGKGMVETRQQVFVAGGVASIVIISLGLIGYLTAGNPTGKFDDRTITLMSEAEKSNYTWENKLLLDYAEFPENNKRNILVIGDSNSGDLLNALIYAFSDRYNYSSITISAGCGNLYAPRSELENLPGAKSASQCYLSKSYNSGELLIDKADYVFIASSWRRFEADNFSVSWDKLNRKFGKKFYVLGAKNITFSKDKIFYRSFNDLHNIVFYPKDEIIQINDKIRRIAGDRYIDPFEMMCDRDVCKFISEGKPIYYDDSHLTKHGTGIMGRWLLGRRLINTEPQAH